MWRMFIKEGPEHIEKVAVNQETGERLQYIQTKHGLVFSETHNNIFDMGWESVREYLQKRYRYLRFDDPQRGIKRTGYIEVDYEAEMQREKSLMLDYGVMLLEMLEKADASRKADWERELQSLYSSLARHGISQADAKLMVGKALRDRSEIR